MSARRVGAASFALSMLLAGCAGFGNARPRTQPLDPHGLAAQQTFKDVPTSPAAWPKRDWWTRADDAQLDVLMAEALANNPGLAIVDARARQAQARAAEADAGLLPTLQGTGAYTGVRIPTSLVPRPYGGSYTDVEQLGLKFDYRLDLWGGKRAQWEAALGSQRAAEVDAQAARVQLSADVATVYAELGYDFDIADVADSELTRARQLLALTQQRRRAGIDSDVPLRQAEAAVPAAERQLKAAQLRIDADRLALAALLGAGPDRGLAIARPPSLPPALVALPSTLPAELLGRRADLVAARWRVEAASKRERAARTEFYPNVDLAAMAGFASMGLEHLLEAGSRYYELAPAITLPIFEGGRLRAGLAGREADYDEAVADYNQKLVKALRDTADALASLRSLEEQADAQHRALEVAWSAYGLSMQRYRAGIGNQLEALAAEQSLLQAEQGVATVHGQQLQATVHLVQALGGGFGDDAAHPAPVLARVPDPLSAIPNRSLP